MRPKQQETSQGKLFEVELESLIKTDHDLVKLSKEINWERFEQKFGGLYSQENGRPGVPTRLLAGLTYLKYLSNCSDEEVLKSWVENPYWQYFCGERYFQKEAPCDRSMLSRWRKKIGEKGAQELFDESLALALNSGAMKMSYLKEVYVDTTVQEKNIAYPSEANLLNKARLNLVKLCEKYNITLRQKYTRVGKRLQIKAHRYAQANQWNRMKKVVKKLRTILGRILRELPRVVPQEQLKAYFEPVLELAIKLYHSPDTKEKVYSLHEPYVEAIAKGKIHKKFEFGNKVSVVRTRREGFILGCKSLHGNPYDGHTLEDVLLDVEARFGAPIKAKVGVDLGYRGHDISTGRHKVFHPKLKKLSRPNRLFIRARSAVESSISYLKRCFRLGKNYLKGKVGDILNSLFAGAALNLTKVARYLT